MREGYTVAELQLPKGIVVGLRQTTRAVKEGRAREVFLACDADPRLTEPLRALCGTLPVRDEYTMVRLGRAAGVTVGTAACAILI